MRRTRAFIACIGTVALLVLSGCDQPQTEPTVAEDNYTSFSGIRGKWEVNSDGPVVIDLQDNNKTISVTGKRGTGGTPTRIKVSGEGYSFNIYEVERVIVAGGADAKAYSCGEVVGLDKTTVHVWSCPQVKLLPGAKSVEAYGTCNIQRVGSATNEK